MSHAMTNYLLDLQEAEQDERYWQKVKQGLIKREDGRTEPTNQERRWIENLLAREMKK